MGFIVYFEPVNIFFKQFLLFFKIFTELFDNFKSFYESNISGFSYSITGVICPEAYFDKITTLFPVKSSVLSFCVFSFSSNN